MENKRDSRLDYLQQIDSYYGGRMAKHNIFTLGETPEFLQQYGAKILPVVMTQKTLRKCIREPKGSRSAHQLDRSIIEKIPEYLEKPVFLVDERNRNSLALIPEAYNQNRDPLLVALAINECKNGMAVNEIKSIYGKTSLKIYLEQHMRNDELYVLNNKGAERISRVIGLQLPKALKSFSFKNSITPSFTNVNPGIEKTTISLLAKAVKIWYTVTGILPII